MLLPAAPLAAQHHAPLQAGTAISGTAEDGTELGLRDLTTDRPDTTESPYTVDAGHVQIETTIVSYTRGPRSATGLRSEQWDVAATNMRIGLTNNFEIALGWQPYASRSGNGGTRIDGVGDAVVRAKLNIWGNDRGSTALAVLPFIVIPTDRRAAIGAADVEYGALVPLAIGIDDRFGLGLNAGVVVARPDRGEPYDVAVPVTASLAVAWSPQIGTYYEVAAEFASDTSVTLNTGLTYKLLASLQLDVGVNIGVTDSAPRYQPFAGLSVRF